MEYDKFVQMAENYASSTNQRRGQAMFNCLIREKPDLAETIKGGMLDPFYSDSKIPHFLNWLKAMWN